MGERLVIVGNGMAATRLIREISSRALGRYNILVIGDEPRPAYNRVLLSSWLAGEIDAAGLDLYAPDWAERTGVTRVFGTPVTQIDRAQRIIHLRNGARVGYDKLVLATGSQAIRLPKPGMTLPGVLTFRDVADVEAMRSMVRPAAPAVVIGGGLLGIEAAYGLTRLGAQVTLVHLMDRLMERQLDARAASMLRGALEQKGIDVRLSADTACVTGSSRADGIELADGTRLPADVIVCAVGIRPSVELARSTGLEAGRGVKVDDSLCTSDPDIFALGECAEHRGICYGLVEPAYDQAKVLAARLAGTDALYEGSTLATNLKVTGINLFSAGDFEGSAGTQALVYSDPVLGVYKKLVLRGSRLAGAMLYGDTSDARWYVELMKSGADVTGMRDGLVFGRDLAQRLAA